MLSVAGSTQESRFVADGIPETVRPFTYSSLFSSFEVLTFSQMVLLLMELGHRCYQSLCISLNQTALFVSHMSYFAADGIQTVRPLIDTTSSYLMLDAQAKSPQAKSPQAKSPQQNLPAAKSPRSKISPQQNLPRQNLPRQNLPRQNLLEVESFHMRGTFP